MSAVEKRLAPGTHCIALEDIFREVSFFTRRGGAPENWGGSGTLSKIKRGDQKTFKLKRGDHLYLKK